MKHGSSHEQICYCRARRPQQSTNLVVGDLNAAVMRDYVECCEGYFDNKDVPAEKQVRKIIAGIKDSRYRDWISTDRPRIQSLTFPVFIAEFKKNYLNDKWESETRRELLAMMQGTKTFWDYAIAVQAKNSLLVGVELHLPEDKLRHRLEAGMEERLAKKCDAEKLEKVLEFKDWLDEVKRVDEELRTDRAKFEAIAKSARDTGRHNNNTLSEPSRCYNTLSSAPASTSTAARLTLSKLTDSEHKLLWDNSGCLKCRRFFQSHVSASCMNDFPNAASYCTLTQTDVDSAKRGQKPKTKAIASVLPNDKDGSESPTHPVAVVLGTSRNPVTYMPVNESTVLDEESDSGSSSKVSSSPTDLLSAAVVGATDGGQPMAASSSELPNIHERHLYWRCSTSGPADSLPISLDALIDNGSHAVLIRDDFVNSLALRHRKLPKPETVELAMQSGGKKVFVELTHWVKLKLHDPSNFWSACTVRAIVTPGLCAPIVLGLPFLVHNNIVVDHAARTVIDKISNFDLLNPVAPAPKPLPKKKLKVFFEELKEDQKVMVAELKMVCAERKCLMERKNEAVKQVDVVGAIRWQIEVLAAQDRLQKLGKKIIGEFADVFAPIPHLDDLPTNVYCRIQLKDAYQTIKTRSYSTPQKYKEAWQTLIQQHLDAGRI